MAYDFNADEVFEMAEQIERNGALFYRKAAGDINDAEAKKLLLELAEMEDDHEKTFAELRASLAGMEKQVTVFDPEDEVGRYLKALADTRVFFKKQIDTTSMEEILKAAITAEKDSIVFYLGMKDMIPERQGKSRMDMIIKEEMGHISLLSHKLMSIAK